MPARWSLPKEAAAFADSEIGRQGLAGIRERRGVHRAQRKGRRNRNRVYRRGAGRRLDRVGGAENARRSRAKNRAAVFRFGESGARVNERRGSRAEFPRQSKQKREVAAMQDLRYPMGRCPSKPALTPDERREAIDAIAQTPDRLKAAISGLSPEKQAHMY